MSLSSVGVYLKLETLMVILNALVALKFISYCTHQPHIKFSFTLHSTYVEIKRLHDSQAAQINGILSVWHATCRPHVRIRKINVKSSGIII